MSAATAYPLRVEAQREPDASRALWLVLLWVVFVVLTLVAGVAILVTGHSPRGIMEVNLGILRWSWRVAYDAYRVIGVGLLVLVTALVLLVRGSYPRPLHDLLVGLHRWMFRVAAHAGLMTDDYPPFRLDQGPQQPSTRTP